MNIRSKNEDKDKKEKDKKAKKNESKNDYQLKPFIEELGRGANGIVYKSSFNGEYVAVKVVKPSSPSQQELVKAEIEIMSILKMKKNKSPHLLPMIALRISQNEEYMIILPFADERTLTCKLGSEWLDKFRFKIMRDITDAIAYLHHKLKWLHNDIKSCNVLISNGNVLVGDFGLSMRIKNAAVVAKSKSLDEKYPRGTPRYNAPELLLKTDFNNTATDVYSLILLLFVILINSKHYIVPFPDKMEKELVQWIGVENNRPNLPADWPKELINFFELGWNSDPTKRPTAPQILEMIIAFEKQGMKLGNEIPEKQIMISLNSSLTLFPPVDHNKEKRNDDVVIAKKLTGSC